MNTLSLRVCVWCWLRLARWGPALLVAALLVYAVLPEEAWARIGGGQGYGRSPRSGGGGGGGGGGGDGDLLFLLIYLCIQYPAVGIPLLLVFVGFMVVRGLLSNVGARQVHRTHHHPTGTPRARRRSSSIPGLDLLRRGDPAFSAPVLQDFLILLHRRAHGALGSGRWEPLAPFVADSGQRQLKAANPGVTEVTELVVGALRVLRVEQRGKYHLLSVRIESTRVERRQSEERRVLVTEEWTLRRAVEARSLPPEAVERLGCPSCGAAIESTPMGACPNCGTPITAGQLQWQLVGVRLDSRRRTEAPELSFWDGGQETSVDEPSIVANDLGARMRELTARHPDFEPPAFVKRVESIYYALQSAWSDGRWEAIRPWVTDPLFQSLRFWIERYTRHGLRNRLEDVQLYRVEIVKVEVDAWYEAITVRLWGSMKDSVVDANGRIVGGNAKLDRHFSEYWTFLRAAGSGGAVHDAKHCPSCAAPLDNVNQAGICGYCDSKITTGRFDWVLSRIEQPEAYSG